MSEEQYLTVTIQEYGYAATHVPVGVRHTPRKLTRKEKAQRWLRNKKWDLGRYLSNKANKLGYYDDNY